MDRVTAGSPAAAQQGPDLGQASIAMPRDYDLLAKEVLALVSEQVARVEAGLEFLKTERTQPVEDLPDYERREQTARRAASFESMHAQNLGIGALDEALLRNCLQVLKDPVVLELTERAAAVLAELYFFSAADEVQREHLQPLVASQLGDLMLMSGEMFAEACAERRAAASAERSYYDWLKWAPDELILDMSRSLAALSARSSGLQFDFADEALGADQRESRALMVGRGMAMAKSAAAGLADLVEHGCERLPEIAEAVAATLTLTFGESFSEVLDYYADPESDEALRISQLYTLTKLYHSLGRIRAAGGGQAIEQLAVINSFADSFAKRLEGLRCGAAEDSEAAFYAAALFEVLKLRS